MVDERSPLLAADRPSIEARGDVNITGPLPSTPALIVVVVPMALGVFLAALDGTIVASSYATIGSEFNQLRNTSWIATGYMLTLTSFQPLYGKLSDIFGRKACLVFAYSVFALGCLLCGLSQNISQLILARGISGIGGGGMTTLVAIILSDVVPLQSRGTWQSLLTIAFSTGSGLGAPLGGFLSDTIGWRWVFLLQIPVALTAIIAVSLALHLPSNNPTDLKRSITRVDFPGAFSLVLAIFFLLLGLDRGGNVAWNDNVTIISLASFTAFSIVFAFVELAAVREPVAPKRIILNPSLIAGYLVSFFSIAAYMNLIFQTSLYFQAVKGMSASSAGVGLMPVILGGVVGSLSGGLIMRSTGKYHFLTVVSYVIMLAGVVVFTVASGTRITFFLAIAAGLFISSLGNGSGVTTTLIGIIANAGSDDQAIATAVTFLCRSLGSVVGISVGSTLVQNTLRLELRRALSGSGQNIDEIINGVRETLKYIDGLNPSAQFAVRASYGKAVQASLYFSVGLAVCSLVSAMFIKEKSLAARKQ